MSRMLAEPIRGLLARIQASFPGQGEPQSGDGSVEVNSIIATASTAYEKIRYLVDYRDEHTIRRNAIERILKRKIFIEHAGVGGGELLSELVNSRYLPKEQASDALALEIDSVIRKFLEVWSKSGSNPGVGKRLFSFAATEIDSHLSPFLYALQESASDAFHATVRTRVVAAHLRPEDIEEQLYCAVWRSLFAADNERLSYELWLLCVPKWREGKAEAQEVVGNLGMTLRRIRAAINDELQWQIVPRIRNESIYFSVISEIVNEYKDRAGRVLDDPKALDTFTRSFLEKRYERENRRIRTSGFRAVIFLFITKMIVALSLEIPYDTITLGAVQYGPLLINLIFPPALLFALTRRVGALGEKNTEKILRGLRGVVYAEGPAPRPIRLRNRFVRTAFIFGAVYLVLLVLVFGGLMGFLAAFGFDPLAIALFVFFLALVSYFAFRIRYRASRWKVVAEESASALLTSIFTFPIIRTGQWLSRTFSSINVFVLILDFIIEVPFKRLLDFSNQFIFYLREKAEEIR
jgi:hypothetical protein